MSLRLTQGDENHLDSPIMILRGLEVVFDCAVKGVADEGFSPLRYAFQPRPSSNRIVISTGAYPDFMPRSTGRGIVCCFH